MSEKVSKESQLVSKHPGLGFGPANWDRPERGRYREERIEDCRNKEIYVTIEFRTIENDKLFCNKVFMS